MTSFITILLEYFNGMKNYDCFKYCLLITSRNPSNKFVVLHEPYKNTFY